ncbi:(2Fe-2S) ferredoxin domain-containing protein [Candidatus Uhrbacteria bacterium]|nr:(2Fe-2S) ferredoxin domain-containing protein [Candidatus Uhrbacteria bacterium]
MNIPFKKIAVCHGPTCGPNGAKKLKQILEETYADNGIEITTRECCGKCSNHNSIVVDDTMTVSNLDEESIKKFIADPDAMIEGAKKEEGELSKKIDELLSSEDFTLS